MPLRLITALVAFALAFFSTACRPGSQGEVSIPTTPFLPSATLPASMTPAPSETPSSLTLQPTVVYVDGVTSAQVNVRAEPSTASNVLGVIPAEMRVEISGKDPGGNWWQIRYPHPDAIEGQGWVTAQYITAGDTSQIPVIGGTETGPDSANAAVVQQQINVRSGPGTDFNSVGTVNPQDVVRLTGKDPNGAWLQIEFPPGPEGRGWVNAAFVQAQGVENLPIIAGSGQVLGTGTPTRIPLTPTATVVPAWQDDDTPDSPVASVGFEPAGTQTFIYNGDVSSPRGDVEDWIGFRPDNQIVFMSLECRGNGSLELQMLENGLPLETYINCSSHLEEVQVQAGSNYLLHLKAVPSAAALQYTNYILTIKTRR